MHTEPLVLKCPNGMEGLRATSNEQIVERSSLLLRGWLFDENKEIVGRKIKTAATIEITDLLLAQKRTGTRGNGIGH